MANSESLQEINELRKENEELRAYKVRHEKETNYAIDIADWDEEFCARFQIEDNNDPWLYYDNPELPTTTFTYTWLEWFKMIALLLDDKDFILLPWHDMPQYAKTLINKGFLRLQPSKKPTFYQH